MRKRMIAFSLFVISLIAIYFTYTIHEFSINNENMVHELKTHLSNEYQAEFKTLDQIVEVDRLKFIICEDSKGNSYYYYLKSSLLNSYRIEHSFKVGDKGAIYRGITIESANGKHYYNIVVDNTIEKREYYEGIIDKEAVKIMTSLKDNFLVVIPYKKTFYIKDLARSGR